MSFILEDTKNIIKLVKCKISYVRKHLCLLGFALKYIGVN